MPVDQIASVSSVDIESVCDVLAQNVRASFSAINEVNTQSDQVMPESSQASVTPRSMPNPLPVPHVAQTGVCGVAAWAAVLNYRFGTSYTNATLATAMADDYSNGTAAFLIWTVTEIMLMTSTMQDVSAPTHFLSAQ